MEQDAANGLWAALKHHLRKLEPEQHAPGRHVTRGKDLVLVVPAAPVGLDDAPSGSKFEVRRPAMGRDIEHLDLVGIVRQQLTQAAPVVAVGFFFKSDDPCRHRQNAVPAHQADGLPIGRDCGALADELERFLVGIFSPSRKRAHPAFL